MNATRVAIAAGYSPKGAEQTGSVLLRNPKVSECVAGQIPGVTSLVGRHALYFTSRSS
jgi:hypothetical protein